MPQPSSGRMARPAAAAIAAIAVLVLLLMRSSELFYFSTYDDVRDIFFRISSSDTNITLAVLVQVVVVHLVVYSLSWFLLALLSNGRREEP